MANDKWSRTVKGRTVSKMLSPQQLAAYQPWIDNGRRLRELAHQLETLSLDATHTAEGWKGQNGLKALCEVWKPRFIAARRQEYPILATCRVLDVCRA